jgi:hypothetical protein
MTAADPNKRWKENRAKYVATLVYLDEPQVVVLDHGDDAKIIGVAIEKDGYDFPFFGAEISFSQWERYIHEFVHLRYLFLLPRWKRWYIFDLARQDDHDWIPLERITKEDAKNPKYLPSDGFFARSHTEELPVIEAPAERTSQDFLIDGTWDPTDFSLFFARYNDIYSFFLGIWKFLWTGTTDEQKRALVDAFTDNTLHSGFNYVNFFGDLKGLVGFDERLAMPAIVKRSPGLLTVTGKEATLGEVRNALDNFDKNQEFLKVQYTELHNYMSRAKLLKKSGERVQRGDAIYKYLQDKSGAFAATLGIDKRPIDRLTANNVVSTAKILLSYHRRLERYHLFFIEGRVRRGDGIQRAVTNSPSITIAETPDA